MCTVRVDSLPHRKWREIQQQPGTAGPGNMLGCCLIFFHFLWGKQSTRTVLYRQMSVIPADIVVNRQLPVNADTSAYLNQTLGPDPGPESLHL